MTSARVVELGERVPIRICEIELSDRVPSIEPRRDDGQAWVAAVVVVRLHDVPLGIFVASLSPSNGLSSTELTDLVRSALGAELRQHLIDDGLPVHELSPVGLPTSSPPECQRWRTQVLNDAPSLSLIIPTRDRADKISACLDRVFECTYPRERLEVVIVDNVPRDESTRRITDAYAANGYPVVYAREDAPGSASARNRGMTAISHDLAVFTDDDALADRWWLAEIAATFVAHPEATAVTGMLLPLELDTLPQLWFEQYGGFSRGFDQRVYTDARSSDPSGPLYPYAAGIFGTGNNMAFRRDALRSLGNFDPALGNGTPALGGVDSEVLLRTVLSAHTLIYQPRAMMWHRHREDYEGLRRQVFSYGTGLTAYLTKTMTHNPKLIADFLSRVPAGIRFAFETGSDKNKRKSQSYPPELTRTELRGMAYGPLAYARSRRKMGPHRTPKARRPR